MSPGIAVASIAPARALRARPRTALRIGGARRAGGLARRRRRLARQRHAAALSSAAVVVGGARNARSGARRRADRDATVAGKARAVAAGIARTAGRVARQAGPRTEAAPPQVGVARAAAGWDGHRAAALFTGRSAQRRRQHARSQGRLALPRAAVAVVRARRPRDRAQAPAACPAVAGERAAVGGKGARRAVDEAVRGARRRERPSDRVAASAAARAPLRTERSRRAARPRGDADATLAPRRAAVGRRAAREPVREARGRGPADEPSVVGGRGLGGVRVSGRWAVGHVCIAEPRVEGARAEELDVLAAARVREHGEEDRQRQGGAAGRAHRKLHASDEPAWIHSGDGANATSLPASQRW